jgi:hypothetical protein
VWAHETHDDEPIDAKLDGMMLVFIPLLLL